MTNTIGFPGLGITLTVNRVAFSVFGKDIYWYALCILTGYLAGLAFVSATCKKRGADPDNIFDICFYGLIFGLIGARIYYCIFDWKSIGGFWGIFRIWEGGIAIYGALIGAIASTYVYCRIKKLNILRIFDVCVPGLFVGQIIGRWGNFFNAEVYGRETDSKRCKRCPPAVFVRGTVESRGAYSAADFPRQKTRRRATVLLLCILVRSRTAFP